MKPKNEQQITNYRIILNTYLHVQAVCARAVCTLHYINRLSSELVALVHIEGPVKFHNNRTINLGTMTLVSFGKIANLIVMHVQTWYARCTHIVRLTFISFDILTVLITVMKHAKFQNQHTISF